MGESNSFIIGATGIGASLIFALLGWMPLYILFGVLCAAGALYNSKFFASGIAGMFSVGVFSAIGWIPSIFYFTVVILVFLFLAQKMAGMYFNTGGGGK